MLYDLIDIFAKEYERQGGDQYITRDYIPVDGDYIIIGRDDNGFKVLDRVEIKQDKKTREIERTNQYIDFICQADYLSRYLSSNKAIKNKNIHSNNYLTFFVRKENLHNGKINNDVISEYYEIFKDPLIKYKKPKLREAYKKIEEIHGGADIKKIEEIEEWMKNNLYSLTEEKDKSYLKVFFHYDIDLYVKESEKYILTNLYNNADYNTIIDDKIFGLPNDNMGLNAKKPYLENKSRKSAVPYLISQEEVLLQKKFFDFLLNQVNMGKTNIYVNEEGISALTNNETLDRDFSGYFIRIRKGMEVIIEDFNIIEAYSNNIRPLDLKNILEFEKTKLEYGKISTRHRLKILINEVFFNNFLITNFFTEAKDIRITDDSLKRNLLLTRTALFRWLNHGNSSGIWKLLKWSMLDLIKGSIFQSHITKANDRFNLYFCLKNYFEKGEDMADILMETKNQLRDKINSESTGSIESDREYYFAVGQLANYFISLSRARVKTHSLARPILNAKTNLIIKNELKKLFKKYGHAITLGRRFNNLYAMVSAYEAKGKVDEDIILAGYLHSNLLYEKREKENSNIGKEDKGE